MLKYIKQNWDVISDNILEVFILLPLTAFGIFTIAILCQAHYQTFAQ